MRLASSSGGKRSTGSKHGDSVMLRVRGVDSKRSRTGNRTLESDLKKRGHKWMLNDSSVVLMLRLKLDERRLKHGRPRLRLEKLKLQLQKQKAKQKECGVALRSRLRREKVLPQLLSSLIGKSRKSRNQTRSTHGVAGATLSVMAMLMDRV